MHVCMYGRGTQPHIFSHDVWVNYNELTATSLESMVKKGNHPQNALIQVSEILQITLPR